MVKYKCLRCGYKHNVKSTFINHLKRKFTCKPLVKDITIKDVYNIYFKIDKNNNNSQYKPMLPDVSQCHPKCHPMSSEMSSEMSSDVIRCHPKCIN